MAKLYFRYGAMGSSKTANAIMVQYNYHERGQNALMIKPGLDKRDGERIVGSRSGLSAPCIYMEEIDSVDLSSYNCVIVDEAQFLSRSQVEKLVDIVDNMGIPVICYGLRADFQGNLFEGSNCLMAWADTIEEIKTVCWCGRKATCNARVIDGRVVRQGEQIVLGGNESYVALCRPHWRRGELAPFEIRKITAGRSAYMPLLLEADPSPENIAVYLNEGEMYLLLISGQVVSEAIVVPCDDGGYEIKNLATRPELRGRGSASKLIRHIEKLYAPRTHTLRVGTSKAMIPFYEKFGFRPEGRIENYFRDHYPQPIIENGEALCDMEILSVQL